MEATTSTKKSDHTKIYLQTRIFGVRSDILERHLLCPLPLQHPAAVVNAEGQPNLSLNPPTKKASGKEPA